jgi:hypothetical protein
MTKNDIAMNWLMRFAGRKNRYGFAPPISKKKNLQIVVRSNLLLAKANL